jgi:hypothetical protein
MMRSKLPGRRSDQVSLGRLFKANGIKLTPVWCRAKRTTGITGKKERETLWKKSSAYLTTQLIPVFPVVWPLLSPTQDWHEVKRMMQTGNTKSTKEETQRAQIYQYFSLRLLCISQ